MNSRSVWAVCAFFAMLPHVPVATAQQTRSVRSGIPPSESAKASPDLDVSRRRAQAPDVLVVTLASAVLPGSGQLLMRQRRSAAYLLLEAAGVAVYMSQARDGRRERKRYQRIARDVARAPFTPTGKTGDWDYYERMEKFVASGEFDAVSGGGVDPEMDVETYNGSVWLLARQTFWRDPESPPDPASPEYASALRFYGDRAVAAEMRWTWAGEPQAYQEFRAAIAGSNSAFRSAGHTASVVLANHFLSAVDAYVSARIRIRRNTDGSIAALADIPFRY